MSTYQVGDIVRVRTYTDIDLTIGPGFINDMQRYCETFVTIMCILEDPGQTWYNIQEDSGQWTWCDDYFEATDYIEKPYEYW